MESLTFPPSEIYNPKLSGNKDFDLIILWTLSKNQFFTWSDFISSPLNIKQATLSNYLNKLISLGLVKKIKRATYEITEKGRNNFIKLRETNDKSHSIIRFPPQLVIVRS